MTPMQASQAVILKDLRKSLMNRLTLATSDFASRCEEVNIPPEAVVATIGDAYATFIASFALDVADISVDDFAEIMRATAQNIKNRRHK